MMKRSGNSTNSPQSSSPLTLMEAAETLLLRQKTAETVATTTTNDDNERANGHGQNINHVITNSSRNSTTTTTTAAKCVDIIGVVRNISKSETVHQLLSSKKSNNNNHKKKKTKVSSTAKVDLWLTDPSIVSYHHHDRRRRQAAHELPNPKNSDTIIVASKQKNQQNSTTAAKKEPEKARATNELDRGILPSGKEWSQQQPERDHQSLTSLSISSSSSCKTERTHIIKSPNIMDDTVNHPINSHHHSHHHHTNLGEPTTPSTHDAVGELTQQSNRCREEESQNNNDNDYDDVRKRSSVLREKNHHENNNSKNNNCNNCNNNSRGEESLSPSFQRETGESFRNDYHHHHHHNPNEHEATKTAKSKTIIEQQHPNNPVTSKDFLQETSAADDADDADDDDDDEMSIRVQGGDDPCCPCFHVVFYGPSHVARVEQEHIQKGDIIRLNGIVPSLRTQMITTTTLAATSRDVAATASTTAHNGQDDNNNVNAYNDDRMDVSSNILTTAVFKLAHDEDRYQNSGPGIRWFCYGNAHSMTIPPKSRSLLVGLDSRHHHHHRHHHNQPQVNDYCEESSVPANMQTPDERITQLVHWWRQGNVESTTTAETTFVGNEFSTAKAKAEGDLPKLPRRKRRLDELQSVGLISTVQIQVTDVRCMTKTSPITISAVPHPRKKARTASARIMNHNKHNNNSTSDSASTEKAIRSSSDVVFATVIDGSTKSPLTFIDTSGKHHATLVEAINRMKTKRLILTNVQTKDSNTLRGLTSSTEDLVLVPTNDTVASLVDKAHSDVFDSMSRSQKTEGDMNQTQQRPVFDTVLSQPASLQHDKQEEDETTFVSCLVDAIVGDKSLKSKDFAALKSTTKFRRLVLSRESGCQQYTKHCVLIVPSDSTISSSSSPSRHRRRRLHTANASILQTLCGGLDARELDKDNDLCGASMNLLRSILEPSNNVELRWTVRTYNHIPIVVKVTLA